MLLVDTSVWIDHLRVGSETLAALLRENQVAMHPMVIGELACGQLKNRQALLRHLDQLPKAKVASHEEVMFLIEQHALMGKGVGYVDCHLLAACKLAGNTPLWTRDKRLENLAGNLGIAFSQSD